MTWRIRDRATFVALREQGRRARCGTVSVTYVPTSTVRPPPRDPPRVAFAVSRRVGPAVVRNRIRRRLRAMVAELAGTEPDLVVGGAYLIAVTPAAATRRPAQLKDDLVGALTTLRRAT